jgi:hypothetical protein
MLTASSGDQVQNMDDCCRKDAVESYGDGRNEGSGAFARKIEFELFVTEIMDRDPGIELVTASLWDGVSSKSPAYEADLGRVDQV